MSVCTSRLAMVYCWLPCLMFIRCMKLPATDVRRSEVHAPLKSPPLSLQAENKGRKASSPSLASAAHLQTRLTGLFAWRNITANVHPKPLVAKEASDDTEQMRANVWSLLIELMSYLGGCCGTACTDNPFALSLQARILNLMALVLRHAK